MLYKQISPQQFAMLAANPALIDYIRQQNQRTEQQAYDEWLASLDPMYQDSAADTKANQEYGDYLNRVAEPQIQDAIAGSTHGGLGGTTNTFAAQREFNLRAQFQKEAEAVKTAKKNEELARISQERSKLDSPYYSSYAGALGGLAPLLNQSTGGGGSMFAPMGGGSSAPASGGGIFGSSQPVRFGAQESASLPVKFSAMPDYEIPNQVFGQPQGLKTPQQQQANTASKIAKASVGLYDLVSKMKRNGIGAKEVGQGAGNFLSGVLGAPGRFLSGVGNAFRSDF